ncbi:HD domain-containing protein [Escherichia coli]|nr:HD domain-containing protein [Escherichia coli]EHY2926851.1 HD domain-containing protein [Escherichia coli]NPM02829.1 HD domain-containing protein [Escherichia coli]HBB0802660.1 HD domain-containing protein [Escherichia coli]
MSIVDKAHMFAVGVYGGVGKKRRYTGEDYVTHPVSVREIVAWHGGTVEMQAAALLHGVIEDTHITIEMVREYFGNRVAEMVLALANVAKPDDGDSIARFIINVRELQKTLDMQTRMIKLADLLDNLTAIKLCAPGSSPIYFAETELILEMVFNGRAIGPDAGVVEYLESKGIEHELLVNVRAVVNKGISDLKPEYRTQYESYKEMIWHKWRQSEYQHSANVTSHPAAGCRC